MPIFRDITDPSDPALTPYLSLRESAERPAATGRFIAEGEIVLRQLAASRFTIESILTTPGKLDALADLYPRLPNATIYRAAKPVIDAIVGFAFHRGVLAVGLRESAPTVESLAHACSTLIVLEDVSNVDNLGGLFRSVSALAPAKTGLILSPGSADPLYRKAIRVSMGHAFNIPFAASADWPRDILALKASGYHLAALTPAPGSINLRDFRPPTDRKLALLVGAEGPGLTQTLLEAADTRLRIPLRADVDSLNLVVATSIALHELFASTHS